MANVTDHLDEIEQKVMSSLKDFQRATVNRIDYLYRNGKKRILVSDEVGLGKTLIARGTIAKMARLCHEEGDRLFKIVYICSNEAIADQNLLKLRITSETLIGKVSTSRLSMQHYIIFKQENDAMRHNQYIQLIPLTPDTSFRMTCGPGNVDERALMYAMLELLPELHEYLTELNIIMKAQAQVHWNSKCMKWRTEAQECNDRSGGQYFSYMTAKLRNELTSQWENGMTYIDRIRARCLAIRQNQGRCVKGNDIIIQLRVIFAKISMEKLEPDLVIMDEFQRFRYLIDANPQSETKMLTDKFFYSPNVRMLLLSATPYKMYSTLEEIDVLQSDEHYEEFLKVMEFLNEDSGDAEHFKTVWKDYSVRLKELSLGDKSILAVKNAAENAMYQTVCRTERITEKQNADIIDDSAVREPVEVLEQDIRSYIQMQKLLDDIGLNMHVPVDYIKSTPYLMSFMRDYKLKKNIEDYFKKHPNQIGKLKRDTLWLNSGSISRYEKIQSNNARLERVMTTILGRGVERLLWMPPSRPYYELQGAYKDAALSSKTLIFSSWEMVPRMLACMISYEAERKTVGKLARDYEARDIKYFSDGEKRYPAPRMNFTVRNDVPAAMTLFCLIYPSLTLADSYDPISCMNEGKSIREIQKQVRSQISEKLQQYPSPQSGNQDLRWYYIAPLLMDGDAYAMNWIRHGNVSENEDEKVKESAGFRTHLKTLLKLYQETKAQSAANLGKRPDDLADVLTDMAIASPAVCLYRTYRKYLKNGELPPSNLASQVARVFINRMNTPEAIAVVELSCGRKSDDAHWQNLLTYCRQGNLQAVFDEYAHLISTGIDNDKMLVEQIHLQILDGMDFRTTQYGVDALNNFKKRINGQRIQMSNIRTHYATAFTKGDGNNTGKDRKKVVRDAFNSPFWPFVLATTSIGQEGLDFHNYCRRIVHWNLPANPIDLEQREGRINRFECLAIRQNVAKRYGGIQFRCDVWKEMFEEASRQEKTEGSSDLIPYWGVRQTEDMVKIERIVPMYPFSRDELAYERLIKILSVYRLTLGQARQEELLEYLFKNCDDPEKLKKLFINLSPFYRDNQT